MIMSKTKASSVLVFDFIINTALTVIELVVGAITGSIALLADGFQNLTDSMVITISYITERLVIKRGLSKAKKESIYRATGMMNAAILIVLAIYIGYIATVRTLHPQHVNAGLVIWIGLLSIVVNGFAAGMLFSRRSSKNIRAPYIGLLFSGLSGVGVFVSGLLAYFSNIENIDGIIGLLIAGILFARSINLLVMSARGR